MIRFASHLIVVVEFRAITLIRYSPAVRVSARTQISVRETTLPEMLAFVVIAVPVPAELYLVTDTIAFVVTSSNSSKVIVMGTISFVEIGAKVNSFT